MSYKKKKKRNFYSTLVLLPTDHIDSYLFYVALIFFNAF